MTFANYDVFVTLVRDVAKDSSGEFSPEIAALPYEYVEKLYGLDNLPFKLAHNFKFLLNKAEHEIKQAKKNHPKLLKEELLYVGKDDAYKENFNPHPVNKDDYPALWILQEFYNNLARHYYNNIPIRDPFFLLKGNLRKYGQLNFPASIDYHSHSIWRTLNSANYPLTCTMDFIITCVMHARYIQESNAKAWQLAVDCVVALADETAFLILDSTRLTQR